VAAYRADIEIGVRGSSRLKELQDRITRLSRSIDDVSVKTLIDRKAVQSVESYTQALGRASNNLREVTIQLDAAGRASGNYAEAISQYVTALGKSNSAQKLQNDLIADEIELRRKQKLTASGIRESTQYGGPIGPGPASPVGTLAGQASPVEERIRRTLQQRADENKLQQALLRLEQKTTTELNRQLEAQESMIRGKREVLNLVDQTARKSRLLAGGPAAGLQGPLAGPGAMGFPVALPMSRVEQKGLEIAAKKQQILQRTVNTRRELSGLAQNLQRLELNSVVAIADANREQVKLNAAKQIGLNLTGQEVRIRRSLQNAGAVQGPALPPSLQGRGGIAFGSRAQGVALGGGFPLLFGGGPGAVLGGAAGGLVGGPGGFAAQIALSAIGQQFDKLGEQAIKVGRALNPLTFDLETFVGAAGIAGTATADFLAKVEQYAGKTEAAKEATKLLAARIGTDATNALKKFGEDAQKLGNQLSIIFTTVLANIARIVGPLIAGLAGAAERAALVGGFKQRKGLTGREAVAQQILGTTGRSGRGKGGAGADIRALGQQIGLTGTTREITEGAKRIAATSQKAYQSAQESALGFKATQLEAAAEGAKSAKKLRDELEKLGIKYEKLLTVSRKDLEIARESDPIKKLRLEQDKQIQQINNKYAEDLKKVTGTQAEQIVLELQANEIALVRLDIEQKISQEYQKQAEKFVNLYTIFSKFQSDLGSSTFRGGPAGAGVGVDVGAAFGMADVLTTSKTETAAQEAKKVLEDLVEPANLVKQTATGIGGAFTESFQSVITGSMGAQEALANFFTRIADAFLDMAAQIITQLIVIKALESAIGLFGGGGGKSIFTGSGPVAFPSGLNIGVAGFKASGGPVGANKPYMVGERGPELFVPGRSGTIVPNDRLGGDNVNVVVNVDAQGSAVQGNAPDARQLGNAVSAAVQAELIRQKRPGGLLA
jgi:hypothetical protein